MLSLLVPDAGHTLVTNISEGIHRAFRNMSNVQKVSVEPLIMLGVL